MDEHITIAAENEQQLKNEMLFTLSQRVSGTLATIVTANEKQQKELQNFLKEHLKEYQFYNLDLTPHSYTSLHKALTELLPEDIQKAGPAEWLINITGLENNIYKSENGKIEYSSLLPQLNFERELLFNQPHILVLWISKSFDSELRKKAPDLMHWLSKRFVFTGENMSLENAEEVLDKGEVEQKGRIAKRTERIIELEATWERLCMDSADKERLIKDKIDILILLGKEYREEFNFIKSEDALKKALSLSEKINLIERGNISFELGLTYLKFKKLKESLLYFQRSLHIAQQQQNENSFAINYREIGRVYEEQRKWPEALDSYQKAIEWNTKTGNKFELGTYHQIGRIYEEQRKWPEALDSYQKAIEWNTKTGNHYDLGASYHQLGVVYAEQSKLTEALDNYQKAIEWNIKTGNEFELGGSYHQIGSVYAEQRKWVEALKNYEKAIYWNTIKGNEFELGYTYHQIGRIYEDQKKWMDALENYQKAIDLSRKTGNDLELGSTYHQLGRTYEQQGEFVKAKEFFLLAKANYEKYDHPFLNNSNDSVKRIEEKIISENKNPILNTL